MEGDLRAQAPTFTVANASPDEGTAGDSACAAGMTAIRASNGSKNSIKHENQGSEAAKEPVYKFSRSPHRGPAHTIFNGATLWQWSGILATYWGTVEWSKYWGRVLFLCFTSLCISTLAVLEAGFCWVALRRQKVNERPVFILGHPRSGTTLLHNMISLDTDRFAFTNTLQCLFPSVFLALNRLRCIFEAALPATRPMDNVPLGFDLPQEDEVAAALLTGGLSPFLLFFFQKKQHQTRLLQCLDFYLDAEGVRPPPSSPPSPFSSAAEDAVPPPPVGTRLLSTAAVSASPEEAMEAGIQPEGTACLADVQLSEEESAESDVQHQEQQQQLEGQTTPAGQGVTSSHGPAVEELSLNQYYARWESYWTFFLRKVSYAVGSDRRLLLKSPAHTARVRLLLKLFPNAQFIYIHRDPFEVFQSMGKMMGSVSPLSNLYDANDEECTDIILKQYQVMFDAYTSDKRLIPAGNLVEVRYSDLEQDLVNVLAQTYRQLGWKQPPVEMWEAYERAHHGDNYQKNSHSRLAPELKRRIARQWATAFEEFGYAGCEA